MHPESPAEPPTRHVSEGMHLTRGSLVVGGIGACEGATSNLGDLCMPSEPRRIGQCAIRHASSTKPRKLRTCEVVSHSGVIITDRSGDPDPISDGNWIFKISL